MDVGVALSGADPARWYVPNRTPARLLPLADRSPALHIEIMKKFFAMALLLASPLLAIETDDCSAAMTKLRTLYELRNLMMKSYTTSYDVERLIDKRIDQLRQPLPDGGYRWVRWARPPSEGPIDKQGHSVGAVQGVSDPDRFEASSDHVYSVRIAVPRKRSLFNSNNPVYVGNARIRYTSGGGIRTKEPAINQWMNPDTSRTIDLEVIADHVDVSLEAATTAKNVKQALVEVHFKQAVAQDDPANPDYSTVQALKRIRTNADAETIDAEIAGVEHDLFPSGESLPLLTFISNIRQADELMGSKKPEDQEKGEKLLKETLRRLR